MLSHWNMIFKAKIKKNANQLIKFLGTKFDLMSKRILAASTEELAKELVSILYDG